MQKYFCNPCGYTYDPEKGIRSTELLLELLCRYSDDWCCPLCGVSKDMFQPCIDNYN